MSMKSCIQTTFCSEHALYLLLFVTNGGGW